MPREQRQHPKQSGKTVKIRKSQGQRKKKQALTADELYERAQAALAFDNYDAALECMRDALELEPENLEVLDAYGALLAELGSSEQAIQVGRLLFGAPFCSCTAWCFRYMHVLDGPLATQYMFASCPDTCERLPAAPFMGGTLQLSSVAHPGPASWQAPHNPTSTPSRHAVAEHGHRRAQVLQRAVQLSPDAGFEKYMYLSQLLEEQPAMDAASKGVQILQQVRHKTGSADNTPAEDHAGCAS